MTAGIAFVAALTRGGGISFDPFRCLRNNPYVP
jgi:hypothetical protein